MQILLSIRYHLFLKSDYYFYSTLFVSFNKNHDKDYVGLAFSFRPFKCFGKACYDMRFAGSLVTCSTSKSSCFLSYRLQLPTSFLVLLYASWLFQCLFLIKRSQNITSLNYYFPLFSFKFTRVLGIHLYVKSILCFIL